MARAFLEVPAFEAVAPFLKSLLVTRKEPGPRRVGGSANERRETRLYAKSRSGMEHVFAKAARSSKSRRLAESCSHFAPIPPRNMPKRGQGPRNSKERETPCRYLSFPRDQRVTGHGRLVLITQRSSVQIRPPQPHTSPRDHDGLGGFVFPFIDHSDQSRWRLGGGRWCRPDGQLPDDSPLGSGGHKRPP